jgi:hypothetical protein
METLTRASAGDRDALLGLSGMPGPTTERRGCRRGCLIALAVVIALAGSAAAYWYWKTDPARADAVLARLDFPASWRLASVEHSRYNFWIPAQNTRFYLVADSPESVAAAARRMLEQSGLSIEEPYGGRGPDCTVDGEPPQTLCFLRAPPGGGLSILLLVVMDRRGAAYYGNTPWFAESAEDEIVVRITIYY